MIKLYAHGGSQNHGCEAIVRATCAMLDTKATLYSNDIQQDLDYQINDICDIKANRISAIRRGSIQWFVSAVETKMTGSYYHTIKYQRKDMLADINRGDLCLSIGGDNYCYEGTDLIAALNKCIRKRGAKTVLWGCSVEPELLNNPEIAKDIASFELITARETISYNALKKVNPHTVLVSDPAFTLKTEFLPFPSGWIEGQMIGINASPLILSNNTNQNTVLEAYKKLMKYILENTRCSIVLVPHVIWKNNDDNTVLNILANEFCNTNRVIILDDCNCEQLKGYIARCRFFIGARTHATIAAYSSGVPTLVMGYSVKSRGIAKDIFGEEGKYVLPVQNLQDPLELTNAFISMYEDENEIRKHLAKVMPEYISNAYRAKNELKKLINRLEGK